MAYTKDVNQTPLAFAVINGTKIVMRTEQLRQLLRAHEELKQLGIGFGKKLGFVAAPETTASFRSLTLQKQLVAKGASKTLASNHRRGVAVDCASDWDYINKIKATMNKWGFFNDLAYVSKDWSRADDTKDAATPIPWDGGHWNWVSNSHCFFYDIINEAPSLLIEISMFQYENKLIQLTEAGYPESGSFALVLNGKKYIIDTNKTKKAFDAIFTIEMRAMGKQSVNKSEWDSIPMGGAWADYKG